MGNHNNKLERKFASLPPQTFPSTNQTQHSSFIRKLSRASKRKKHNVNIQNGNAGKSGGNTSPSKQQVPVKDSLFMPEYPMLPYVDNGRFKILEIIARGAFGNVVRVLDDEDQGVFAMKIMRKSRVMVDGAVQQCKDEATIQNAVGNHPFIVKPYYFFQNAESVYIVMEYIPRGELFAAWKHCECFSENLVKIYIAELALVIDFLHRAGIIYRDLKMENILIDAQGHVQVIDFGLAKWLMTGQRTRTICGTLQYIAPEVLSMNPYGHSVDWWSLGILMYALLTGEYPVNGAKNHWEMAKKISKNKYLLPSCYTSEARQLVTKLLKFDPEERIHDVMVLQREPFFLDVKFETIVKRELNPDVYLAAQASFGFGHREASLSRTTSRGTSLDGDLESSRSSSQKPTKGKCNWNESVASLNANLV